MRLIVTAIFTFGTLCAALGQPYKNAELTLKKRLEDLLSRMTLEDKVAQLRSTYSAYPKVNQTLLNDPNIMDSLFGKGIGMINPDFECTLEQNIEYRNRIQGFLQKETRLGIPAIFIDEAHHGLLANRSDVFPTGIGLACSWDTVLTTEIYAYVADQARSRGTTMVLAPVVDIARDPRWGRTGETFGEDPYLCGVMGSAVVRGFQGSNDGNILANHVASTLKHFTGYGQSEGGINQGPADFPERTLRTFHMEPFRLAISRVHPAAIMPAYIDIDGVPAHANSWLLTGILRKEWRFEGLIVSDWWAIDQLWQKHRVAINKNDAAYQAFTAGVTVDLPMGNNYGELVGLVKEGKISIQALDQAVRQVLTLKFNLGLFDKSNYINLDSVLIRVNRPEGRSLARKAAEESMVLLKNADHILPLQMEKCRKIAVVGPCAATNYLGDYSGTPVHNVSILEGLRERVGDNAEILYSKGVDLSLNGDTISMNNFQFIDSLVRPNHGNNLRKIDSAVAIARQADVVICAIGENEQFSREAQAPHHYGDVSTLELQSDQEDLVKALIATGTPVIVYLAHGRPLILNYIAEHANAIVDGWFTGEQSGIAFAHILFGDANPSGKLPISIPRTTGQIPIYYNHKPSAQFLPYLTDANTPIYPFGYGLSYTSFSYTVPRLSTAKVNSNGFVNVSVDITNTGTRKGDEIVQLYIRQKVGSVTRPLKELKDFSRATLAPGETKTVSFLLDASKLAAWNRNMEYVIEPGTYEIMLGNSSIDVKSVELTVDKDSVR